MGRNYRYIGEDTLQYVSLHDCDCSHLYYADDCLIFEMEWMEILRTHPLNPFPQAHQSGEGRIELVEPRIVECTLAVKGSEEIRSVSDVREMDYGEMEFLICDEACREEGTDVHYAEMYMIFDRDSCYDDLSLKIEYRKSLVMWDAFHAVSWFEGI